MGTIPPPVGVEVEPIKEYPALRTIQSYFTPDIRRSLLMATVMFSAIPAGGLCTDAKARTQLTVMISENGQAMWLLILACLLVPLPLFFEAVLSIAFKQAVDYDKIGESRGHMQITKRYQRQEYYGEGAVQLALLRLAIPAITLMTWAAVPLMYWLF